MAEDTTDLVVLDVHLSDLHGFEVCRAIKESPATAHIPVLEVSSVFVSREDHVARCAAVPSGTWSSLDDEELVATCRILVSAGHAEGKLRRALADAIARAQLETELRARARQHAAVADLARQALADSDLYSLMDAAVDTVVCTLDVEYAGVLELLPSGDFLLLRAEMGWEGGLVGDATVGSGPESQAGYTLTSDPPVIAEDLSAETRFREPPLLVQHRVVSGMTVVIFG